MYMTLFVLGKKERENENIKMYICSPFLNYLKLVHFFFNGRTCTTDFAHFPLVQFCLINLLYLMLHDV